MFSVLKKTSIRINSSLKVFLRQFPYRSEDSVRATTDEARDGPSNNRSLGFLCVVRQREILMTDLV